MIPGLVRKCQGSSDCTTDGLDGRLVSAPGASIAVDGALAEIPYVVDRRLGEFGKRPAVPLRAFARQAAVAQTVRLLDKRRVERRRLPTLLHGSPEALMLLEAPSCHAIRSNQRAAELNGQPIRPDLASAEVPAHCQLLHADGTPYSPGELWSRGGCTLMLRTDHLRKRRRRRCGGV